MIYPWQHLQLQQLLQARRDQRLAHALLFTGPVGIGKHHFAKYFTQALLCQQVDANGVPCQQCHSCHLTEGRAHPNLLWVEPEEAGHAIKVDQVRDLGEFISQTSLQGYYRIVVINPAQNMNDNAANALLKTLEEPAKDALLILICDQQGKLPATILSRCQRIVFNKPSTEQAIVWLQNQLQDTELNAKHLLNIANGAPLLALHLTTEKERLTQRQILLHGLYSLIQKTDTPVQLAANVREVEGFVLVDFFTAWLVDLLKLQVNSGANIINNDYLSQLQQLAQETNMTKNVSLMRYIQQLREQLSRGINFNKPLIWEHLFIRWMECVKCI